MDDQLRQGMLKEMQAGNWDTFLVYADLLEEEGQAELAHTYRWMGMRKRLPGKRTKYPSRRKVPERYQWEWRDSYRSDFYHSYAFYLPHLVFFALGKCKSRHMYHCYYFSWESAVADLTHALTTLRAAYGLKPTEEAHG